VRVFYTTSLSILLHRIVLFYEIKLTAGNRPKKAEQNDGGRMAMGKDQWNDVSS